MMARLDGKIVFVTGASSGIGAACAAAFAREGARLLLCARRLQRLEAVSAQIASETGAAMRLIALDVRDQPAVASAIAALPDEWKEIDILINNAGLSRGLSKIHEGLLSDWEEMIDTNVKGLLYVTREVVRGMAERGRGGHVINIGSIAGHEAYPGGNVYCGTKAAVRAITKSMRMDLVDSGIRVSAVDPGMVETEFSLVRFHGDAERAKGVYKGLTPLSGDDVADVVVFAATRPPHVNLGEVVLLPTAQAAAMVVHRKPAS
jgi:3-hydroxy acid dehydrogenase / malonic semialdehyde reductase